MKTTRTLLILLCSALCLTLFGCGGGGSTPPPPPTLRVTTTSLANGTVGQAYSATLQATGGSGGYSWNVSSGNLPAGLSLSAGRITGTPTAAGTSNFTVQVTSGTQNASADLTITIDEPPALSVTTTSLASGTVGQAYSATLQATGGIGGYAWSVTSGNLPSGLSLSNAGTISGTPTTTGTSNFTVQVTSGLRNATANLSITIDPPPALSVTTTSLASGTVGQAYSATLQATGGIGGYTWSVTSGNLPTGVSLSNVGTISGTPTATGTSNFRVQVTSGTQTATADLSITIDEAPLSITTTSLPSGVVNQAYSVTLQATGGVGGYSWTVSSGNLPDGLSLSGSGTISGTPTAADTSNFTVQVTSGTQNATADLSITIGTGGGRNDTIATATPLTNGTWNASISPYANAIDGGADTDYYKITALAGATVHAETVAAYPNPANPFDSVIEIVDANGHRYNTCNDVVDDTYNPPLFTDPTPGAYDDMCINDDKAPGNLDSLLDFKVPGTAGTPVTFYVHVFDWRGDARPDMVYQISISGAQ